LFFALIAFVCAERRLAPLFNSNPDGKAHLNTYIVVYHPMPKPKFAAELEQVRTNVKIVREFNLVFQGYAAVLDTESAVEAVRRNPLVKYVEADGVATIADCVVPIEVDSWGLTRVSQEILDLDFQYSYPTVAGTGVDAYVCDTGVYLEHNDFEGRAFFDWKANSGWSDTDRNGHGTHVASTIGGKEYGVARKVTLRSVKILGDNGSGTWEGVIAGLEYVLGNALRTGKPSTINLSIQGGKMQSVNDACDACFLQGDIVVVAAAGNYNADACNFSPASAPEALTVGSTDVAGMGENQVDIRSSFSNYGRNCVDVFAPGSGITAAWIGSPDAIRSISGTSMACPHVVGVASLLFSSGVDSAAKVKDMVVNSASKDQIDLSGSCSVPACRDSPNLLVFNGCTHTQTTTTRND